MIIAELSTQRVIANKAVLADTPWARMKGLLGRTRFLDGEGMVITHCNSIHMFFMRFAIDVVFVDAAWKTVGLVRRIEPFKMSPVFWQAAAAIELPAGTIERFGIELGQRFLLDKINR